MNNLFVFVENEGDDVTIVVAKSKEEADSIIFKKKLETEEQSWHEMQIKLATPDSNKFRPTGDKLRKMLEQMTRTTKGGSTFLQPLENHLERFNKKIHN